MDIAAKMKEARALAKEANEYARARIKERTEEVQRLLGEAREKAWELAAATTNIAGLASELVQQTDSNHAERATGIATLASAFVEAVQAGYDRSSYDGIKGHYTNSMGIQRDLVEAKRGVD
jgi:citrate synthase